jgi:hypothetical protein
MKTLENNDILNQQMKKKSKLNTPLISCTAQVQEQYQKITCKSLGPHRYHLIIQCTCSFGTCLVP